MTKLNGKVAIVTGASRGIGQTIAELFAEEGAKVICSARTLVEGDHQLEGSINRTVSLIKERGGEAHPVAADVSNPDDCIRLIEHSLGVKGVQSWCEIDPERCTGCNVCIQLPQKKTNPHALVICPWDAIELVPTENAAQVMAQIGGPPDYIRENWDRLVGTAQHLAELKAGG